MSRLSNFATAVHANLADATVLQVVGQLNKGRNTQRRRVHWYREGGEIVPPHQAGGRISDGDEATGTRAPAVWQREEQITCHVFAESEDTLDTLLDNLIVAIDRTAPNGSVIFGNYTWAATDKDEFAKRVPMVELQCVVKLPVLDEQKSLVEITAEELTCTIDEDL